MKTFTEKDITKSGDHNNIRSILLTDFLHAPLPWQKRGLSQTRSGYGAKLTSEYKICFEGKLYRIYHTCYGNASSSWFRQGKRKIFVH